MIVEIDKQYLVISKYGIKLTHEASNVCLKQGRKEMVKSVLQALPSYVISISLLPKTLINEIEKIMNGF